MSARWAVAVIVVLLLALVPPAGGLTEQERAGGWSGALPKGIAVGLAPTITMRNVTIPIVHGNDALGYIGYLIEDPFDFIMMNVTLTLEIYKWSILGQEKDLPGLNVTVPAILPSGMVVANGTKCTIPLPDILSKSTATTPRVNISVPPEVQLGFYGVRMRFEFRQGDHTHALRVSKSRGYFQDATWDALVSAARKGQDLTNVSAGVDGILPEAGFTVAPKDFSYISLPNRVPDLGNFTTPTIRPGRSGTYNLTVTNRYNEEITDAKLEVEVYMWATLESSRTIARLGGPAPRFKDAKSTNVTVDLGTIGARLSKPVKLDITTKKDTPKGTYFVEHKLTFKHNGTAYTMSSRGYFTSAQWEGFAYNNLYYQLGVSGIVPDSSFNVKDPVPMWPLGVLVTLCALFGALAVVFYLAEEHGPEYPRLKKALQYWTGKYEQRRRLLEQRLDELRREVDVADEDDEGQ
jgi:hypothetical protein